MRLRLLLLTVTCAASVPAFVDLRSEPQRWEPGVRLVERLADAVEVPPAPAKNVVAGIGELRFPRGARYVAIPFRPEPLRGFVVRLRVKTPRGKPPPIRFIALTSAQARRFGNAPVGLDAPPRGRPIGDCFFTALPEDGWTMCQRYQGIDAGESAVAMVIEAGGEPLEAREFEVFEAEQIPPWAPAQPQLAPLLRYAGNGTASGDSYRTCLRAPAGGRYVFDVVLPPRAELLVSTGLDPGQRTAPTRFVVRVDGRVLLEDVVRSPEWHDHALQLPDAPNRRVRVELASEAIPGEPGEARGLWGDPRVLARSEAPSILLLSLDAVRPDHLSAYGYRRDTSPALDRVAQTGVRFGRATAQGGRTWISVLSFLSGRQPIRVGVRSIRNRLPNAVPLLPDMLAKRGYDTFAGSDLATTRPGQINRFDEEELYLTAAARPGARRDVSSPLILQMRRIAPRMAQRPTFAWFHLEHAHYPLEPRDPFRYDPGYRGRFREIFTQEDHFKYHQPSSLRPAELDHVRALYDSSICDADEVVREMLLLLDAAGATQRTIVVITADHGEELGDHDLTLEHTTPWDHVLHVPLLFLWPGHFPPGHVVPQRVQLADLVPTLLSLAGLDPEPGLDGRDLSPLLRGGSLPEAPAYAELVPGLAIQYRGDEKLILNPLERSSRWRWHVVEYGKERLYDVGSDPDEQHDLSQKEPVRLAGAKAALIGAMKQFEVAADGLRGAAAGQAAFEMLQQAGYVQGGAPAADAEER